MAFGWKNQKSIYTYFYVCLCSFVLDSIDSIAIYRTKNYIVDQCGSAGGVCSWRAHTYAVCAPTSGRL